MSVAQLLADQKSLPEAKRESRKERRETGEETEKIEEEIPKQESPK